MRKTLVALVALMCLLRLFAAAPTAWRALDVDVSALPADHRLVADLVRTRVAERTCLQAAAPAYRVTFALDASVPGEQARIAAGADRAEIRAGRLRGLVYGAGWFLKWIDYRADAFSVRPTTHLFAPAKSLRMAYFARHLFNWYMEAPEAELVRYIEDLALDGINAFLYQFSVAEVDAAHATPEWIAGFERTSRKMCDRIGALDCDFCEWGGSNQLRQNAPERLRGAPNDRKRGNLGFNACPEKPGAREAMCALRRENLAKLAGCPVGYLCHWSFDEGGCACAACSPWGAKGMLKTIEPLHALNAAAFPKAKTIVSTWYFYEEDFDGLWKYLATHDWIDWVLCDDYGLKFPEYPLTHPIPGRTKIATFPDISMWGRFPWGGYGAIALPKFLTARFRQSAAVADGFVYYSEGCYEDVNKAIELGLYLDPDEDPDAMLRRYAKYHFAGSDPEDFVALAHLLETNHSVDKLTDTGTAAAVARAEKIDGALLPALRASWRWRLVLLRARIDRGIFEAGERWPKKLHPLFDEVVRIYHAERQLQWVLDGGRGGWTCPGYRPADRPCRIYAAPEGDATPVLQAFLDDRMRETFRLGPGVWRTGPLRLRDRAEPSARIVFELQPGCRLTADTAKCTGASALVTCDEGLSFKIVCKPGARIDLPSGLKSFAPRVAR